MIKKNKKLVYYKETFLERLLLKTIKLYQTFRASYALKIIAKNPEDTFKLFYIYMKEIEKEIHKQFGENTKLIVLAYNKADDYSKGWDIFENNGITVIKLNDISDIIIDNEEYKQEDCFHPNAKAWEVIVPALAKKLEL